MPLTNEGIREAVRSFYRGLAENRLTIEGDPLALALSLGYNEDELRQLPEGTNIGLSCGNPLEKVTLAPGETLLDLGSGTGVDCFLARLRFPKAGTIYGLDQDDVMIQRASQAAAKKGFQGVEFRLGDLTAFPFPDGSIDKIISNCVINLVPEKDLVYREIFRVLRPGGSAFISDISLKRPLPASMSDNPRLHGT